MLIPQKSALSVLSMKPNETHPKKLNLLLDLMEANRAVATRWKQIGGVYSFRARQKWPRAV